MSNNNPILKDFGKAIRKLEKILQIKKTEIVRDSAVKRFELCFDLAWKSIKIYAAKENIECYSPRSCIKTAFQLKLIDYNEEWLKMIDDRSLTTHLYHEEYADHVYSKLPDYLRLFKELFSSIKKCQSQRSFF